VNRLRFWRLRRLYERIPELERRLVDSDFGEKIIDLRVAFTNASYRELEHVFKRRGMPRQEIRRRRRRIVAGKPVREGS
jgi:hypothetical protein